MTHKKCVKGKVYGQKSLTIFRCDMGKLRLNCCVIDNKTCINRLHELFRIECFELLPNEIRKLPTGVLLGLPDSFVPTNSKKEQC